MYGYREEDMVILTDDQRDPRAVPTKANMIRACQWLVKDAQPHDSLFLHYSGHGGQTPDLNGDEESGFDEVIYPVDFQTAGHIVDDDLHELLVKPLPPGARLTSLMDCCPLPQSLIYRMCTPPRVFSRSLICLRIRARMHCLRS